MKTSMILLTIAFGIPLALWGSEHKSISFGERSLSFAESAECMHNNYRLKANKDTKNTLHVFLYETSDANGHWKSILKSIDLSRLTWKLRNPDLSQIKKDLRGLEDLGSKTKEEFIKALDEQVAVETKKPRYLWATLYATTATVGSIGVYYLYKRWTV
ncbi:MAG: hypothetical protein WCE21_03275 [Candidatus Babeliales bacterium]